MSLQGPCDSLPWIRETTAAEFAVCPECDDMHEELPIVRTMPDGSLRWFIPCPELLRVEIIPECLRRWSIDFMAFTVHLAQTLGLTGSTKEVMPDRVWRLGKTKWEQTSRDVLFVRGMSWPDARDAAGVVEKTTQPIVLVSERIPDEHVWLRRIPAVVALSYVSHLSHTGLTIDRDHLFASISDQRTEAGEPAAKVISTKKQKLMIRQQVKAEIESMLTDDALTAAYEQHGSYREAADALSAQTGQPISKDRVFRAVKRKGGTKTVHSDTNSGSVRRTVASQRCDGKKKIQNRPEAMDFT